MAFSEKQREASRRNGAKSRGPKTPEGKQRSSLNARTHGMLADVILLDNECEDTFRKLAQAFHDRFQPTDLVEEGYVQEMVAAHWRLRRVWAAETRLLDRELDRDLAPGEDEYDRIAYAFESLATKDGLSLGLLHRYETRLHRMHARALESLQKLRAERPAPPPPDPEPVPAPPLPETPLPNEPEIRLRPAPLHRPDSQPRTLPVGLPEPREPKP